MKEEMKNWLKGLVLVLTGVILLAGCGSNSDTSTQKEQKKSAVDWPLYEISADGETVGYMLGSIHIGRSEMYPFPDKIENIVKDSSVVYSEVKLSVMSSTSASSAALQAIVEEPHILTNLSEEEKQTLEQNLESYEITIDDLEGLNYFGLTSQIQAKYIDTSHTANGVETKMSKLVDEYELPNEGFETVEEQYQIFNESYGQIVLKDNTWINDIPTLSVTKKENEKLLDMYINGKIEKNHAELFPQEDSEMILDQRNYNWIEQLKEVLPAQEQTFILVGVGHFYGDAGLIPLLEELDYSVKKVET